MGHGDPYTAGEDWIILHSRSSGSAFKRLRGRRTFQAVVQRRWLLKNPEPKPGIFQTKIGKEIWTEEAKAILKEHWPIAESTAEVRRMLPQYTPSQIRSKASHLGLKRRFLGSAKVVFMGHKELVDQIRIRAKEDGISLRRLDKLLHCGYYFETANWRRNRINLVHVAHAIEFFGGTLVIDWCDR